MNKEQLLDYIDHGREIEFRFDRKMYSITYGTIENEHVISFCEFYKESTEVKHAEEICAVVRNGVNVLQMLESLSEDEIWIY